MATPLYFPKLRGQAVSVNKKPHFDTLSAQHASGRETRAPRYVYPLWDFETVFEALDARATGRGAIEGASMQTLVGFFEQLQGRYGTFLYVDPSDYAVIGQPIGTGDGTTTSFAMVRTIAGFTEPVGAVTNANAVYLNGVAQAAGWSVPAATPYLLTFTSPPAAGVAITVDFTFAFVCRLGVDVAQFEEFLAMLMACKTLPFESVRHPNPPGATSGAGAIPGPFAPAMQGVHLNTSNSAGGLGYLQVTSQTGPVSSNVLTFSCWFRLPSLSTRQVLFDSPVEGGVSGVRVEVNTDGSITYGVGDDIAHMLVIQTAANKVSTGQWHHIFVSSDTTNVPETYNMWLDGVNAMPGLVEPGFAPVYYNINGIPLWICDINNPSTFDCYDFWLDYAHYLDQTHVPSFISGGNAVPLGAHGEVPLSGTPPTYFFHDGVPAFATNLGSGDQPIVQGALSYAAPPGPP